MQTNIFTAYALQFILKQQLSGVSGIVGLTLNTNNKSLRGLRAGSKLDYPKVFPGYTPKAGN